MNRQILIILFIGIMSSGFAMAGDWSVFQGQYYIEPEMKAAADSQEGGDGRQEYGQYDTDYIQYISLPKSHTDLFIR